MDVKSNKKILVNGDIVRIKASNRKILYLVCLDNNYKSDKIYYKLENMETTQTSNRRKPFNMILFYTRDELTNLIHLNKLKLIENIPEKAHLLLKYR